MLNIYGRGCPGALKPRGWRREIVQQPRALPEAVHDEEVRLSRSKQRLEVEYTGSNLSTRILLRPVGIRTVCVKVSNLSFTRAIVSASILSLLKVECVGVCARTRAFHT